MMIHAVYFEVDEGEEIAHTGPDDVYVLDIILMYASEPDSQTAEAVANEVKGKIEQAFKAKLFQYRIRQVAGHRVEICRCNFG